MDTRKQMKLLCLLTVYVVSGPVSGDFCNLQVACPTGGGETIKPNLRQCSWQNINDEREHGPIRTCRLIKKSGDTTLRVEWNGDIRLMRSGEYATGAAVCRRWFFTIGGAECQSPLPIDLQLHVQETDSNMHRPVNLNGYCTGIPAGQVDVTFNVGDCQQVGHYQTGNAYTGWTATSRIIVEELDLDPSFIN